MNGAWKVIMIVVAIALALGAVCAGVGALTGADTERIAAVLEKRVEDKYNVDGRAVITEWVPEVYQNVRETLAG